MTTVSTLASLVRLAKPSHRFDPAAQQRRLADNAFARDIQSEAPDTVHNPVRGVLFGLVLSLPLWLVIIWLV